MNAKKLAVALLSALALMPGWTKLAAEPLVFFFSGQITERRATNSVFTEPDTDQFNGYFSYDTSATPIWSSAYPLLSFSIDGNSLTYPSTNFPFTPLYSEVIVQNNFSGGQEPQDRLLVRGFYPPATNNIGNDDGSIYVDLTDYSGLVFTNISLPTSLSLSSFDVAQVIGPGLGAAPPPSQIQSYDQGTITQLIQVPEPAAWATLSLGLAVYYRRWRTRSRRTRQKT